MPIGTAIGDTLAVTDNQVIAAAPKGSQLLDLLIGETFIDGSLDDFLFTIPERKIFFDTIIGTANGEVARINKGAITQAFTIGQSIWSTADGMVFNIAGAQSTQLAAYEGPMWQWDNLDADLWVWAEGGGAGTQYGNLIVMSEGWWVAGGSEPVRTDTSSGGNKYSYKLGPSSRIEMNGHMFSCAARFYFMKFRYDSKEAT